MSVDIDAVLAEARARVQEKRASGAFGAAVDAALSAPLPGGGPLLTDELEDPVGALGTVLQEDIGYDATSRRRIVGAPVTFARKSVISLIRWWITALFERQERVNKLVTAALVQQRDRPSPGYDARLRKVEEALAARARDEVAADLHSVYFQARFGGDEPVIAAQAAQFVDLFAGRTRVCDLGSGRGTFLALAKERGIGAYGVDLDPRMVEHASGLGLEVVADDALAHLRSLEPASIDGLFARHIAEHVLPGELVAILRELRRVLRPGSPIVLITPNPATLTVGAHTFWLDPSHRRPIPPELFRFYLEVEGFVRVSLRTFEPSDERLNEDVPAGATRDNVRLLNRTLFGDRDYAVVGFAPEA
ncbi:MAG TPA: class I SAM-dependent methyltransferase [Candidatus Saccharimonadales bacterium]|jgi:O-antigen chain-terminating methyltransferase|nr:class I SAM-dependent methyltransferase [Candidatus Saccharimonadales bacterium]